MTSPLVEPIRNINAVSNAAIPTSATELFASESNRSAIMLQNCGGANLYVALMPRGGAPVDYVSTTEYMWKIAAGVAEPLVVAVGPSISVVIIGDAASGNYNAYEVSS